MRSILKVIAVGNLVSSEKWMSRKGFVYARGKLLCKSPSQIELPFTSFNKEINERLFRDDLRGERVKIIGNACMWNNLLSISVYRLVRATAVYDKAEFVCIGFLKEIIEDDELLNILVEAKGSFKGQNISRTLQITTKNRQNLKERLACIEEKQILAKGIIRETADNAGRRIICWLNSLDVLRERVLKQIEAKSDATGGRNE